MSASADSIAAEAMWLGEVLTGSAGRAPRRWAAIVRRFAAKWSRTPKHAAAFATSELAEKPETLNASRCFGFRPRADMKQTACPYGANSGLTHDESSGVAGSACDLPYPRASSSSLSLSGVRGRARPAPRRLRYVAIAMAIHVACESLQKDELPGNRPNSCPRPEILQRGDGRRMDEQLANVSAWIAKIQQ